MFSLSRGDRHGVDCRGMVRDCCLEAVRALIPISPPPWATKSPFQRGATECQAWNERTYLAAIVWLRLRRAEKVPASAPHTFPVRAIPPQKPVAILGIRSDWMPWLSATACKTLPEQPKPLSKSSAARSATSSGSRGMVPSLIGEPCSLSSCSSVPRFPRLRPGCSTSDRPGRHL
jgi:hypothetical protein